MRTGEFTYRHTTVCAAFLAAMTTDVGLFGIRRESSEPFVRAGRWELRMDMVLPRGQLAWPDSDGAAKDILMDVTLPDPTNVTNRAAASRRGGAIADIAEVDKINKYSDLLEPASQTLVTLSTDLFGAASQATHSFVRALAKHQWAKSEGRYPFSQCTARLRQRLSVTLQRAVSVSVARNLAETARTEGGQPPSIDAYMRVHLLHDLALSPALHTVSHHGTGP